MEEKKILFGMPCSKRLEIVWALDPQALSCLFRNHDTWPWVKTEETPKILKTTKDSKKHPYIRTKKILIEYKI